MSEKKVRLPKGAYENCQYCLHRAECWNSDSYGDAGTCKLPYPKGNCIRYKFDASFGGVQ